MSHNVSRLTLIGWLVAGVLTAAQAPAPARPQDLPPPVTFRTEIAYVEVSARILDQEGNFVPNLTKDDFRIVEDGKPQTINAFGFVRIPVVRPEKPEFLERAIDADVVSNVRGNEGRLYVLVLDDLHTDPLRSQQVRVAARKFIEENLGANDLAAVSVIGSNVATQELTGNRTLLLAAIDRFIGQQPRNQTLEKIEEYNRRVGIGMIDRGGDTSDPYIMERRQNARRSFRQLTRLADWMGSIHGRRKALIYVSEGVGYDLSDIFRNLNGATQPLKPNFLEILDDTREVITAATRSDVNIYAIDPRGMGAGGDELIELASGADAGNPTDASDPAFNNGSTNFRADLGMKSLQSELQSAQDGLRMLSEQTGGFATVSTNDFTTAFARIVEENSSYYILGYYSNNERRDGRFRKIDVQLPNRSGLEVRARKGYLAPRGRPRTSEAGTDDTPNVSAQLREFLTSPVPLSGVTFSATAATYKGKSPNNTVVITVEARASDLNLTEKDGKFVGSLSVALAAVDYNGKLRASATPRLDLGFRPETYERIAQNGNVRLVSQIELPPGRYQLRAALLDGVAKNGGSVQYDLNVPDFTKGPLSMSSVMLASAETSQSPTVVDRHIDPSLPEPTSVREFASSDQLAFYVEVYDNQRGPVHKVDVVTTVRAADGLVVSRNEQERSSDELQRRGDLASVSAQFPLKELRPGLYVLTVEARSRIGNLEPVSQMIQFRVR
jgi:VWFA-related protein